MSKMFLQMIFSFDTQLFFLPAYFKLGDFANEDGNVPVRLFPLSARISSFAMLDKSGIEPLSLLSLKSLRQTQQVSINAEV